MAWTRWKAAERQVAKEMGGTRRVRVLYNEKIGDIIHHKYSIEVKYGKQIPKYAIVKVPTLVVNSKDEVLYTLIPLWYWKQDSWQGYFWTNCIFREKAVFLERVIKQARRYDRTKTPIGALKPPRFQGFILVLEGEGS